MVGPDEKTPTRPAPAPHVESGQKQFETTLASLLDTKLEPLNKSRETEIKLLRDNADSLLDLDARTKKNERAIASLVAHRVVVGWIALMFAVAAFTLALSNRIRVIHHHEQPGHEHGHAEE